MFSIFNTKQNVIVRIAAGILICCSLFFAFQPIVAQAQNHEDSNFFENKAEELAAGAAEKALNNTFSGICGGHTGGDCVTYNIVRFGVWNMQFSLFILGIVGVLLDLTLLLTFNMGAILAPGTSAGAAVAAGWTVFRDLANLMFIAGFVWVSIAMILQVQVPGGNAGKFIANIIIAALLVNFSYFFTGAIIDASNTMSRLIYEQGVLDGKQSLTIGTATGNRVQSIQESIRQITSGSAQNTITTVDQENDTEQAGINPYVSFIAGQFLHQTKLVSILSPEDIAAEANKDPTYTLSFFTLIATVFIVMTIELFAGLLFVILARFVILILLLILSPLIVFRIMGIAPFSEWGEQWWKSLVSQVIFLPVFVFLTAVSFRTIHGFVETFAGSDNITLGGLLRDPTGSHFNAALGLILLFMLAFAMLKYSKTIAQNMAQGKTMPLPSVEGIQKAAAGAGDAVGTRVGALGRAPGSIAYRLFGSGVSGLTRELGDIPGVSGARDRFRAAASYLPGANRQEYLRQERKRKAGEEKIKDANAEIAKWEERLAAAEEANDAQAIATAQTQIQNQKDRRKSGYNDMYDSMGPAALAQYLRKNPQEIEGAIDSLEDEKAADIAERLKGVSTPKKKGEEEASRNTDGGNGEGDASGEKILATLQNLTDVEKGAALREQLRGTRMLSIFTNFASTEQGARAARAELGEGGLGELPISTIKQNNAILREMNEADFAVLAGRSDVSNDDYKEAQRQWEIVQERSAIAQPSDIARTEDSSTTSGNDGQGLRAQRRINDRRDDRLNR